MCTVSYVPLSSSSFILTSNRDETVSRGLASEPVKMEWNGVNICCPVDPLAHGSWIAASDRRMVVCLLNGAFKPHKRTLPYRMSRGIVVLDSLSYPSADDFASFYNLDNIEPFTLVIVQNKIELKLHELRWDGEQKHFKELDSSKHVLWSSATLYDEELIVEKEEVFEKYLISQSNGSAEAMIEIHSHFLYQEWLRPPARVEEVATLSTTSVVADEKEFTMYYRDLVRKELPLTTTGFKYAKENS